jgi:ribosomal protein S6
MKKGQKKLSGTKTKEQWDVDLEIQQLIDCLERQNQLFTEIIRELMIESQKDQTKKNQQ